MIIKEVENYSNSVCFIIDDNGMEFRINMNRNHYERMDEDDLVEELKGIIVDRKRHIDVNKNSNLLIGKEL